MIADKSICASVSPPGGQCLQAWTAGSSLVKSKPTFLAIFHCCLAVAAVETWLRSTARELCGFCRSPGGWARGAQGQTPDPPFPVTRVPSSIWGLGAPGEGDSAAGARSAAPAICSVLTPVPWHRVAPDPPAVLAQAGPGWQSSQPEPAHMGWAACAGSGASRARHDGDEAPAGHRGDLLMLDGPSGQGKGC